MSNIKIPNNYNKKLGQKYSKEEYFKNLFSNENIKQESLFNRFFKSSIRKISFLQNKKKKPIKLEIKADVLYSAIKSNKILINFNTELGKGSYSTVYEIKYDGNDKKYVFKLTKINEETHERTLREYKGLIFHILLQRRLRSYSPNLLSKICNIYEIGKCNILKTQFYYSIMDNCGEELLEYIKKNKENYDNLNTIVELMIQMCECIKVLHDIRYMYLDFKPQNFLIDNNGNIKLIDFGFILKINTMTTNSPGTLKYISPYFIYKRENTEIKILPYLDLFSIGYFFVEMIYFGIFKKYEIIDNLYSVLPYNESLLKSDNFKIFKNKLLIQKYREYCIQEFINKLDNEGIKIYNCEIIREILNICTSKPNENNTIDTLIDKFNQLLEYNRISNITDNNPTNDTIPINIFPEEYNNNNNNNNNTNIKDYSYTSISSTNTSINESTNLNELYNQFNNNNIQNEPSSLYELYKQFSLKNKFNPINKLSPNTPILFLLNPNFFSNLYCIIFIIYNLCKTIIFIKNINIKKELETPQNLLYNKYFNHELIRIDENKKIVIKNIKSIKTSNRINEFYETPNSLESIPDEQKYIFSLGCFLIGMICIKIYERPTFFTDSMVCPIKINFKGDISEKRNKYTNEKHRQNLNKINCRLITSGHSVEVSNTVCDIIDKMVNPDLTYPERYTDINKITEELNKLIDLIKTNGEQYVTLRNSQRCSVQNGLNKFKEPNSTRSRIFSRFRRPFTKELPTNGIYKPKN